MFDKLIEILQNAWDSINPFFIMKQFNNGILLRKGVFLKVLYPGLHLKVPFIDHIEQYNIVTNTYNLPAQSLITKDKKNIVVRGMIKYKITDIKIFLLDVYEPRDAISDIAQAVIKNVITSKNMSECTDSDIDNEITKKIRVETKKWGVETQQVTLTDISDMKSFRIINDQPINAIT